jgi:hypothetical protein
LHRSNKKNFPPPSIAAWTANSSDSGEIERLRTVSQMEQKKKKKSCFVFLGVIIDEKFNEM